MVEKGTAYKREKPIGGNAVFANISMKGLVSRDYLHYFFYQL
jgi:hypothetical protein